MQLPEEFIEKYRRLLGEEAPAFLASFDQPSQSGFRVNPLKAAPQDTIDRATGRVPYVPTGYYGTVDGKSLDHVAGAIYSQEPSAMYVGEVVDPQPGERVLDLCAAPGGKTTHLVAKMGDTGLLVANEIFRKRAKVLAENLERWGTRSTVVMNESPAELEDQFPRFFDRILVDAPCSGEGMFRKEPAGIEYWNPDYPAECANRQRKILASALKMLKPGGILVYSTCTFAPEEDEQNLAWLLATYPELKTVPIKKYPGMDDGRPEWGTITRPCAMLSVSSLTTSKGRGTSLPNCRTALQPQIRRSRQLVIDVIRRSAISVPVWTRRPRLNLRLFVTAYGRTISLSGF